MRVLDQIIKDPCMVYIFTYIYHKSQPNVGKYSIHIDICFWICFSLSRQLWRFNIDVLMFESPWAPWDNNRFPPVAVFFYNDDFRNRNYTIFPPRSSKLGRFCRSRTEDIPMLIEVSGSGETSWILGETSSFWWNEFVWKSAFQRWDDFAQMWLWSFIKWDISTPR